MGAQHTALRPAEGISVARMTCHSTFKKLARFDVSDTYFLNIWQLLMVLFPFNPKSGIFDGFKLLGIPKV